MKRDARAQDLVERLLARPLGEGGQPPSDRFTGEPGDQASGTPVPHEAEKPTAVDDDELVEAWITKKGGRPSGQMLEELVEVLGYTGGFDEFFDDNSGGVEALIEWISEWVPKTASFGKEGWAARIRADLEGEGGEDDGTLEYGQR